MSTSGSSKVSAAIIGSGNIGTDLMMKILRHGRHIEVGAMVGIDANSDGLARAARLGIVTTASGIHGLLTMQNFPEIRVAFDATSAGAHCQHNELLQQHGVRVIDLTPAAVGPFVVPSVNLEAHLASTNINMVTCGGQATIPIVAAVSSVSRVHYAEIVASISSRSAGPGTRANIDEFTETTSKALEVVGGAGRGKAIIILNPAEPPMIMRDTVYTLSDLVDKKLIEDSVHAMVERVQRYVPGFRLKQNIQFDEVVAPLHCGGTGPGLKTTVFLEVEGAAHYLPAYAGNLDIMTSAALACAEKIAELSWSN
ncbi:acetaldehyde dehydrogenase [Paraburkholderia sp. BL18I3N2]|uniref:acetaldehyde dehydrogenase (acetylating) n=1 Tax=Paraburkholderia sp. BL18I3N2 TaxID=1938799 RepID=UPI000D055327|nr:acetaldehyde dehydrogenase (acetylating) [Paraburkholderia sp. BL18I3N2]PRX27313.1 acetaldehyde dehydrogenase [Paraburkholderia sp. BL18I3N2]